MGSVPHWQLTPLGPRQFFLFVFAMTVAISLVPETFPVGINQDGGSNVER